MSITSELILLFNIKRTRDQIYSRWNISVISSRKLFFFLIKLETRDIFVCVRHSDVAGSKAWKQETRNERIFVSTELWGGQREKDRKANTLFFAFFFAFLFSFFFFSFNVLNPRFQFFRRCPLPWHRRLLSPPLCLLLWFRISVLAFGYLKKSQRKNIKRNSRINLECRIALYFFCFVL